MPTAVAYGSSYAITVAMPLYRPHLTCDVTNLTGTMGTVAVANVTVKCTDPPAVSGSISGLGSATGLVLINGTDKSTVPAGATSFALDAGAAVPRQHLCGPRALLDRPA